MPKTHVPLAGFSGKGAHSSARDLGASTSVDAHDADLRRAVLVSLISEPCLTTRHIGVSVKGGVVTLSGYVTSHPQKEVAGAVARRVKGVDVVTDTLGVAVPCVEDLSVTGNVDRRRTLTLPGPLVRTAGARDRAPDDAYTDDRS